MTRLGEVLLLLLAIAESRRGKELELLVLVSNCQWQFQQDCLREERRLLREGKEEFCLRAIVSHSSKIHLP